MNVLTGKSRGKEAGRIIGDVSAFLFASNGSAVSAHGPY
jgi:hypothetical protein